VAIGRAIDHPGRLPASGGASGVVEPPRAGGAAARWEVADADRVVRYAPAMHGQRVRAGVAGSRR
jgi:hypothetical protein